MPGVCYLLVVTVEAAGVTTFRAGTQAAALLLGATVAEIAAESVTMTLSGPCPGAALRDLHEPALLISEHY